MFYGLFFYTGVLNETSIHFEDLGVFLYKTNPFMQGTLSKYIVQLKYISDYT